MVAGSCDCLGSQGFLAGLGKEETTEFLDRLLPGLVSADLLWSQMSQWEKKASKWL